MHLTKPGFAGFVMMALTTAIFLPTAAQTQSAPQGVTKPAQSLPTNLSEWTGRWAGNAALSPEIRARLGASLEVRGKPIRVEDLTPEYAAKREALEKAAREGRSDAGADCITPGMPIIVSTPYLAEYLIHPEKVVILYESMGQFRQIFTDGRPHPPEDELTETYNGHSIGHWEGDTLVVDTVGIKDVTMIERSVRHSDALHIIERIRLTSPDVMETQMTLIDPKAFTKPQTKVIRRGRETKWDIQEYVCNENNRNPTDATGRPTVTPPKASPQ